MTLKEEFKKHDIAELKKKRDKCYTQMRELELKIKRISNYIRIKKNE